MLYYDLTYSKDDNGYYCQIRALYTVCCAKPFEFDERGDEIIKTHLHAAAGAIEREVHKLID